MIARLSSNETATMTQLPSPRSIREPAPVMPRGNPITRTLRAVIKERRLPTRLENARVDLLVAVGRRFKTIEVDGLRFQVRHRAPDAHFVADVVRGLYTPAGYGIGECDIVIDVGGNIGAFAVWAGRQAARGMVISLEPAAENFAVLQSNVQLNGLANVKPIRAALADRSGTVALHLAERSSGDHTINRSLIGKTRGVESVKAVTLDELLEDYQLDHCDLIKFNCEGAEVPVVLALDAATASRLRRVVLGYHTAPEGDKRVQSDALVGRLIDLGFTIDDYTDIVDTNRGTIYARRP
jgi:FkbM family methyltransferase